MRYICLSVMLQTYIALTAIAMPVPDGVKAGDIVKARPKNYQYPLPRTSKVGEHPVVVLTNPDKHGFVKITTISHTHPMNPPTKPASMFGLPIDPIKGESQVNVAGPERIHVNDLKTTNAQRMQPHHFNALKDEIVRNCPGALRRRNDVPDPCSRQSMQAAARRKQQMEMQSTHSNSVRGKNTRPSHSPHHAGGSSHGPRKIGSSSTHGRHPYRGVWP